MLAPMGGLDGKIAGSGLSAKEKLSKHVDLVKGHLAPVLSQLRPWSELLPVRKPLSGTQLRTQIPKNLVYFQANYTVIGFSLFLFSMLTTPSAVALIGVLLIYWGWFIGKNEDPEWQVVIANIPLLARQRLLASVALSIVLVFLVVGGLIMSAIGITAFLCVTHSAVSGREIADDLDVI